MTFPTAVLTQMQKALEGQIANNSISQGHACVAYGTMAPGSFVTWHSGDADSVARLPTTSAEITGPGGKGILPYEGLVANNPYLAGDAVTPLSICEIYVTPEEAVTPADPVYVRFAAGAGGSSLGRFRKSADTATAALLAGAKWLDSGDGTAPVRLRFVS